MVSQHCGSQEEKWKMASRVHGPKQSMPKRPVPHALDKPAGGCNSGLVDAIAGHPRMSFLFAFEGYQ